MASWLTQRGATHIFLLGRNSPKDEAQKEISSNGVKVFFINADVTNRTALEQVLTQIKVLEIPLKGVFHCAGVLDDGPISNLTWSQFEQVLKPKVEGATNLHELTKDIPLQSFVMFSSITSVEGSAGSFAFANL